GQQNDYVLVSLVRTRTVGHLRDVRRLIVALSRARLGLYIFARIEQFANCPELKPAFDLLLNRTSDESKQMKPTELHLTPWEVWIDPRSPTILKEQHRLQTDYELNQPPLIIKDMPQMSNYVRELYDQKLQYLMTQLQKQQHVQNKTTTISNTGTTTTATTTVNSKDITIGNDSSSSLSISSTDLNKLPQEQQQRLESATTENNHSGDVMCISQGLDHTASLMLVDNDDASGVSIGTPITTPTINTDEANADNSVEMADTN
ncbi:unnamed protein product, partial [Schistosoma margrebowiei]